MLKKLLKNILKKLRLDGIVWNVAWKLASLKDCLGLFVPPGHFYSPIPSLKEIGRDEESIFSITGRDIPGVELNEAGQLELLEHFTRYYGDIPFDAHKLPGLRYSFENDAFGYGDAITLYCMLRHVKPGRVIEIGSGHSSCVFLDTNEKHFNKSISYTFIEPYPEKFLSLISEEDRRNITIHPDRLQDVDMGIFKELGEGDILFVDSSHVSKTGSDVNHIFFRVLPALNSGVYIHFHDIVFPFEYPKEWVYEGKAWNEAYVLKTFLQYNNAFNIVFFNSFICTFHESRIRESMPLYLKNPGGSIWLKKQ